MNDLLLEVRTVITAIIHMRKSFAMLKESQNVHRQGTTDRIW